MYVALEGNTMSDVDPSGGAAELVVSAVRVFNVPVEDVWKAWSDAKYVERWWGPTGFTASLATHDFRPGGTSLLRMSSPEYGDVYNTWNYQVVTPLQRIEFIMNFSDESGTTLDPADAGIPPGVPRDVPHVVTFETADAQTTLTVTEHGYTSEQAVQISQLGLDQCLDKMVAIFAR